MFPLMLNRDYCCVCTCIATLIQAWVPPMQSSLACNFLFVFQWFQITCLQSLIILLTIMCKFRQFYGHPDSPLHFKSQSAEVTTYTHGCKRTLYEANKFGYSEMMVVGKTELCRRITETKGANKIQAIQSRNRFKLHQKVVGMTKITFAKEEVQVRLHLRLERGLSS